MFLYVCCNAVLHCFAALIIFIHFLCSMIPCPAFSPWGKPQAKGASTSTRNAKPSNGNQWFPKFFRPLSWVGLPEVRGSCHNVESNKTWLIYMCYMCNTTLFDLIWSYFCDFCALPFVLQEKHGGKASWEAKNGKCALAAKDTWSRGKLIASHDMCGTCSSEDPLFCQSL